MRTDISDCDAEAILAFLLILSHGHRNFFFVIAKSLSPSLDEIVCPCFEPAILLDQLKTALIEPAYETFDGSNVFLRLVEHRHL